MANVSTGAVHNEEHVCGVGTPSTAHPSLHPTTRPPATGAATAEGLERKSVAEAVGPEGVASATTMVVEPSGPGEPPHLHAPGLAAVEAEHGHGGGLKQKAKEVWHEIKEITPGTKEHRAEFGTDMALGGYRSQMGKR